MATPWVILGRVLRVGFVPGDVVAEDAGAQAAGHGAAAGANAQALEEDVVAVDDDEEAAQVVVDAVAAVEEEEDDDEEAQVVDVVVAAVEHQEQEQNAAPHAAANAAAAPEPDFSFSAMPPPRVTVLAAGPGGHPDGANLDKYPYIVAAEPNFLLVHFSTAPFRGTNFGDNPYPTDLVLLRHFHTSADDGLTTASSVRIPGRTGYAPTLWNIGRVGLYADAHEHGRYKIAELSVDKGSERAKLVSFGSVYHPTRAAEWHVQEMEYPMAEENRDWVPHGAVTVDSTIWWFDLSWGILSCDVDEHEPELNFHYVPDGRGLAMATPDIHTRRAITVSRGKLRYVEIVVTGGGGSAATVCMWTRMIGPDGWNWYVKYAMSFERIWDDHSYRETGLPRNLPVLAVVCPSNPALVYFALEQRLFGVNVPAHRVVHSQAYELVNIPDQPQQPPSGRYVVAWNLPPEVAQASNV
nr:unnamed protein product [Digitaria exilis]